MRSIHHVPLFVGQLKVCSKMLTGRNLHTWLGMVGYVFKCIGQPAFRATYEGISPEARVSCLSSDLICLAR